VARGKQYVILSIRFHKDNAIAQVRNFSTGEEFELEVKDFTYFFVGVTQDQNQNPGHKFKVMGIRDRVSLLPQR